LCPLGIRIVACSGKGCGHGGHAPQAAFKVRSREGKWFRAYGNENWEFDENGLMKKRYASINDLEIKEPDRSL